MRYTVAVDFDGVLHSYTTPWSGAAECPDPPVPGAIEWLNGIVEEFDVVILTTRGDQEGGNEAVLEWLREHGYTGPDVRVTSQKVPALLYIDDRAWRFEGNNFPTADQIHRALPWTKQRAPLDRADEESGKAVRFRMLVGVSREDIEEELLPLMPLVAGGVSEDLWTNDVEGTAETFERLRASYDPGGDMEWREMWAVFDRDTLGDAFKIARVEGKVEP